MLEQGERQTPCKKQRTEQAADEQPPPPRLVACTKDTVRQNVKNWYSDATLRLQGMHIPYEDVRQIGSQCALCAHTYKEQIRVKVWCPTCKVNLHLGSCWMRAHSEHNPQSTWLADRKRKKR